jgi:LytS/YehU family sensor histidine kinase
VDEGLSDCRVPPLLLQPLIENAITHGIAGLLEGGIIHLAITRRDGRMSIVIDNPRDSDVKSARGAGVGLENVRRRLAMTFPGDARMDAAATSDRFRVEINLPCIAHD